VTFRRTLFGLAVLAAVVLVGLPVARLLRPDAEAVRPALPAQPEAAVAAVEPIRLGSDEPLAEPIDVPDWEALNSQTTTVAGRARESVVYVVVSPEGAAPGRGEGGYDAADSEAGSGIVLSPDGYVLTNAHVVERAGRVSVVLTDKREYQAEVVGRDLTTDVAVLRLLEARAEGELPVADLGDSDALQIGETVLVVGSPFRLQGTVTQGIVSALGRQIQAIEDDLRIEDFIQTDASVNQGNSGGALVNLRGETVGLVTAIASETGYSEGYGFAIPMNLARRVAEDLITYGEVRRGYLGVDALTVTAADAEEAGMDRIHGVLVQGVVSGGPAARAGVRPGDILLAVGGKPVDELNQFQSRLAQSRPGQRVGLTVWRNGGARELQASLISQNDPVFQRWLASRDPAAVAPPPAEGGTPGTSDAADWGIRFRDLTAADRSRARVSAGALVETVQPGSAADLDGLPEGTIVVEVEGRPVGSAEEARVALARQARTDRPALLRVRRPDGRTAFFDLLSPRVD
jgi:serine protease Do